MFKVGDKVVRTKAIRGAWMINPIVVIARIDGTGNLYFDRVAGGWYAGNFKLYEEPALVPKFKVGDKVVFTNNKKKKQDTKIEGVLIGYEVKINHCTAIVRESQLTEPPPVPREITVDGVTYREVI